MKLKTLIATRSLPGHPLSPQNSVEVLLKNNVTVAIGFEGEISQARNTRFDIAWVCSEIDNMGILSCLRSFLARFGRGRCNL